MNPAVRRAVNQLFLSSSLLVLLVALVWFLLSQTADLPLMIHYLFVVVLGLQMIDALCRGMLAGALELVVVMQMGDALCRGMLAGALELAALTPPDTGTEQGGLVICCSGGGIKSASFCLGALHRLDKAGIYGRAKRLVGVSGGGYAAAAFSLAPEESADSTSASPSGRRSGTIFGVDSTALRSQRQRTNYLADSSRTAFQFILSLLFGIILNLIAAAAALLILVRVVSEWAIDSGYVQKNRDVPDLKVCVPDLNWGCGGDCLKWDWTLAVIVGPPVFLLSLTFILFLLDRAFWPDEISVPRWSSRAESAYWSQVSPRLVSVAWWWTLAFPLLMLVASWESKMNISGPLPDVPEWLKVLVSSSLFAGAVRWVRKGLTTPSPQGFWGVLLMQIRMNVLPRILILLLAVGAYLLAAGALNMLVFSPPGHWLWSEVLLVAAVGILLAFRLGGSANFTSMYPFYRDRLAYAFLYQECKDRPNGSCRHGGSPEKCTVRVPPSTLTFDSIDHRRPALVLCATANLRDHDLLPSGRQATPFIISRQETGLTDKHLGSHGLRKLEEYSEAASAPLRNLGSAIAISGAAVSPWSAAIAGRSAPSACY